VKQNNGKVRVVYKNMIVHPQQVTRGHWAGCAAAKAGKFLEFKHAWWEKAFPGKYDDNTIVEIAKSLGIDESKFKSDMDSDDCKQRVQGDQAELAKWHVNATPNFFINGRYFQWDGTPNSFQAAIKEQLDTVEKSGVSCGDYYDKVVIDKGEKKYRSKKDPKPS
jgi:predicted DsbA family dithiol-disulfide isomerase